MRTKLFIIFLLFFPILFTYSKQDSSKIVKSINYDDDGFSEAKAYKMLYENQVKSNDAVLKTIYYALGGLGTAILLVFASNWWFNDKKVKDVLNDSNVKILAIKKDTITELTEKINTLVNEKSDDLINTKNQLQEKVTLSLSNITDRFNDFTEKIRAEIKEENKSLVNNYQDLLKSYNDNLSQQISTLKESYDDKILILTNLISSNEKTFDLRLDVISKEIKRDVLKHKADLAFIKGHFNSALKAYTDYAINEFKIGYDWSFKYNLSDIINCLEKLAKIYDDEFEALNSLVEISKEHYPEDTEKLIGYYRIKPIEKLQV